MKQINKLKTNHFFFFSDGTRYDVTHGSQLQQPTQEHRKFLKRTRSLAVISEDECSRERFIAGGGSSCGSSSSIFDTSSLQHQRRPQLIPRAKLIDRSTLKER